MDKIGKIRILVLTAIFLVFLFGVLVFAEELNSTNNVLTYSNNDLTVDIKDSLNQELGAVTLKSHNLANEVKHIFGGNDKVVMYYDFSGWVGYENGLGEVSFIDMNTGREAEKDYYFAERILYEECTETGNVLNGSLNTVCTEKERWNRLENNNIPSRDITIGLITDVEKGDYYDSIWTIAGKKIEKHALWDYTGDTINISGGQLTFIITLICVMFIIFIIVRHRTIIKTRYY